MLCRRLGNARTQAPGKSQAVVALLPTSGICSIIGLICGRTAPCIKRQSKRKDREGTDFERWRRRTLIGGLSVVRGGNEPKNLAALTPASCRQGLYFSMVTGDFRPSSLASLFSSFFPDHVLSKSRHKCCGIYYHRDFLIVSFLYLTELSCIIKTAKGLLHIP